MNRIILSGMPSEPTYLYEYHGQKFYKTFIESKRLSDERDVIPCVISENILECIEVDKPIKVVGFIKTRNEGIVRKRLNIFVFVNLIEPYSGEDENNVVIDGYICKKPNHRKTPLTNKDITDLVIACNRKENISDYIPGICWGKVAKDMAGLNVGTYIKGIGRLQSRVYEKNLGDTTELKIAYELSLSKVKECEENGNQN